MLSNVKQHPKKVILKLDSELNLISSIVYIFSVVIRNRWT